MHLPCTDAPVVHRSQRPRPVCCVCKSEFVSKANRCRCEASSAFQSSANPPHPLRPLSPHGFFLPMLQMAGSMQSVQQCLHEWWSSVCLQESIVILERVEHAGVSLPPPLLSWLRQVDINVIDLEDPETLTAALSVIQVVSDAHRAMSLAAQKRCHQKPNAKDFFRWLWEASEGTFLRSQACAVQTMSVLDDFEWPAFLAAALESSLLSSCPPHLTSMLVPACDWQPTASSRRRHRRTTRGKGRSIQKRHDVHDDHDDSTVATCLSLGVSSHSTDQMSGLEVSSAEPGTRDDVLFASHTCGQHRDETRMVHKGSITLADLAGHPPMINPCKCSHSSTSCCCSSAHDPTRSDRLTKCQIASDYASLCLDSGRTILSWCPTSAAFDP